MSNSRLIKNGLHIALALGVASLLFVAAPAMSHPGNTASDGCHYCRTNCDYWGVAWNQRHCHGGSAASRLPSSYTPTRATPITTEMRSDIVSQSDFLGNTDNGQKDEEDQLVWWLAGGAAGLYGLRKAWKWAFNQE